MNARAPKYPHAIRFGIPSFDHLFGRTKFSAEIETGAACPYGFTLPNSTESKAASTSFCLVGPDGTGKSVFALHLASAYAYDSLRWFELCKPKAGEFPRILYVSTDLQFAMAENTWKNFSLGDPRQRIPPFVPESHRTPTTANPDWTVHFSDSSPETIATSLLDPRISVNKKCAYVDFVDLAARSAGDDWGFLHALLAALPAPHKLSPRHLVVVDAVEGFETLTGERNAFGEETSRRARIAQVMRLAAHKCHLAMVVEQPHDGERLAEEFVSDVVVRFRADRMHGYTTRSVELVKARAQSHVRGAHAFVVRGGRGSTTGKQENPDDPTVGHSYVQIFPSLHLVNRELMERRRSVLDPDEPLNARARFGIEFLDDMLDDDTVGSGGGLPCSKTTSLIGDSGTEKSQLGIAFLAEALRELVESLRVATKEPQGKALLRAFRCWLELREGLANRELSPHWDPAMVELMDSYKRSTSELPQGIGELCFTPMPAPDPRGMSLLLDKDLGYLLRQIRGDFRIPVLITTKDENVESVVRQFGRWLQLSAEEQVDFDPVLRAVTICRRMEIHHASASIIFHAIRRCVERAQYYLFGGDVPENISDRRRESWKVRLVIDDLRNFQATYPDVGNDPVFLPSLVFHLENEGVTTLVVETHPARLDNPVVDTFETKLRALVQRHIYTWQVTFNGERRIAISIAPTPPGKSMVIREVANRSTRDLAQPPLFVDPHFELYSGLEEGRPKRIPLEVRLYAETPAFEGYIHALNTLFEDVFISRAEAFGGERGQVVRGMPTAEYEHLRDLCNVQRGVYFDYSLVFQVDEFWGLQDNTALREQNNYLIREETCKYNKQQAMIDPYGLFQPTQAIKPIKVRERWTRRDFFRLRGLTLNPGEDEARNPEKKILRVPFTWDFGFLLCKERAWTMAAGSVVNDAFRIIIPHSKETSGSVRVQHIWDGARRLLGGNSPTVRLPLARQKNGQLFLPHWSWRAFFGACRSVATQEAKRVNKGVIPFDFSAIAPQSVSCIVLEIWLSEILSELYGRHLLKPGADSKDELTNFLNLTNNSWDQRKDFGLEDLVKKYDKAFERTLCLLVGAIDFTSLIDPARPYSFKERAASVNAVATRHWYKTATEFQDQVSPEEPLMPTALPGYFSTRGDWYLAVLKNGRSSRLADRALDLLNSRRANILRLQHGLGLPVRDLLAEDDKYKWGFRTRLMVEREGRREAVGYDELCDLVPKHGTPSKDSTFGNFPLRWFWRSDLRNYDRQSAIWLKWLHRVAEQFVSLTYQGRDSYLKNFAVYDYLVLRDVLDRFGDTEPVEWGRQNGLILKHVAEAYSSVKEEIKFESLKQFLVADLEHSCPQGRPSDSR